MTVIGNLPDQSEATGGRHGFGGASPVGLNSGGASPVHLQPPEIPGQLLQVRILTLFYRSYDVSGLLVYSQENYTSICLTKCNNFILYNFKSNIHFFPHYFWSYDI